MNYWLKDNIVTDDGSHFNDNEVDKYCLRKEILKTLTTPINRKETDGWKEQGANRSDQENVGLIPLKEVAKIILTVLRMTRYSNLGLR